MPNIPQQDTLIQYVANSSQTQYTFAFYAFATTNLAVYYQASNATPVPANDLLVNGVDYTVTFNSDPTTGGYITLQFTPTTGYYLTIELNLQYTLNTNFAAAATFNGGNLDAALDYLLMLIQQNANYIFNRNLSYVVNTYLPNATPFTQLPPLAQNQFWMGSGSGVIAATVSQVPSASVLQSALANNSPSTDGATLVGYYNNITSTSTTVDSTLSYILTVLNNDIPYIMPIGAMLDFAGTSAPTGWLLCNGAAVSRTTYANLFAVIGTTWGSGDGSTTFNLPDFRRRVAVGSGGTGTGVLGNAVGNNGGGETVTLALGNIPSPSYTASWSYTAATAGNQGVTFSTFEATGALSSSKTVNITDNFGGASPTPTSVIQPSNVVLKIIKF